MAVLLYGSGLRLLECARLRVQDMDFAMNQVVVRDGKGAKDRVTVLPAVAKEPLARHMQRVKRQHEADLAHGAGWSSYRGPSRENTRTPAGSGPGSGSSPPPGSTSIGSRANAVVIICTRAWCSAP